MNKKICLLIILCLCFMTVICLGTPQIELKEVDNDVAPIVSAKGAVLIDGKDAGIIYAKDAQRILYPASTTKIMTALVALEILEEIDAGMNSRVKIPREAVGVEGSSLYLKENEEVSIEELMYGMMLHSGNDAATAIAICTGGSMENFLRRMNERATAIGCKSTHFSNPSGLFDEEHFTTALDLALISREAMENEDFRKIVSASEWTSPETGRKFRNKNKTIGGYDGATGVKIGYTKASGRTLVASAQKGEKELIAVVLSAPDWFSDAYALLDYGFMREGDR